MLELKAAPRVPGRGLGTLRKEGFVPAVLYGPDVAPLSLSVGWLDFQRIFTQAGESSLVRLLVDHDGDVRQFVVLIRDVQRDPLHERPVHVDFHAVRLNEEIKVDVPIAFTGEAPIEKRGEGVVVKELYELEVEALPEKLPHEVTVDLSGLDAIERTVTVADLRLPEGVRVTAGPETVLARAAPLVSEAELAELETPPEEAVEAVEVIRASKEENAEEGAETSENNASAEKS